MVDTLVTMVTSNGTISVARNTTKSVPLERELEERERVPGQNVAVTTWPAVIRTVTMKLFLR